MLFKLWLEARKSNTIKCQWCGKERPNTPGICSNCHRFPNVNSNSNSVTIPFNKLYGWRPKVIEAIDEIKQNKLSFTDGPISVSQLDSIPGAFFMVNGYHRVLQAMMKNEQSIQAVIDPYVPYIERPAEAHKTMIDDKVLIIDFAKDFI